MPADGGRPASDLSDGDAGWPDSGWNASSGFAALLIRALGEAGVRRFVVCPGSRSQALALALAAAAAAGEVELAVRIDERVAGFLALGAAKSSGRPVAVVTTSGSAGGHLLPAVMEAWHVGAPVIPITCDRPDELLGIGANQTTWQPGLFGRFVADCVEVNADAYQPGPLAAARVARGVAGRVGWWPLQINVQFRDPLSGAAPEAAEVARLLAASDGSGTDGVVAGAGAARSMEARTPMGGVPAAEVFSPGATSAVEATGADPAPVAVPAAGTVVIAGAGAPRGVAEQCERADVPLCAEIVSGERRGTAVVPAYAQVLADGLAGGARRGPAAEATTVVVYGRPTLTRPVQAYLREPGRRVIVVDPSPVPFRPAGSQAAATVQFDGCAPREWLERWIAAGGRLAEPADDADQVRRDLVAAVWNATGPEDAVAFAASELVRVADRVLPPRDAEVYANRGLAGIDGTLSTAIGAAWARPGIRPGAASAPSAAGAFHPRRRGLVRVLTGDLAFLHDAGGLWRPRGEALPPVQAVVGDDQGGSIFDHLEVAETAPPAAFDQVMRTPHDADLVALAASYGWPVRRVPVSGLEARLRESGPGVFVVALGG
jgi:2-succinyl-5-enolpyruvyl-6-hydroxy-3-cyclohexene-1-carboxylate synthase